MYPFCIPVHLLVYPVSPVCPPVSLCISLCPIVSPVSSCILCIILYPSVSPVSPCISCIPCVALCSPVFPCIPLYFIVSSCIPLNIYLYLVRTISILSFVSRSKKIEIRCFHNYWSFSIYFVRFVHSSRLCIVRSIKSFVLFENYSFFKGTLKKSFV